MGTMFMGNGVKGVVGRADDSFARYRQQLHHLVFIHNRRQDGVEVQLGRCFAVS